LYQNALNVYENGIVAPLEQLHNVGSAGLSRLQSVRAELQQKYVAALSTLAFFVMPAAAILSVTGQDVTDLLLGEKWHQSGVLLSIIALGGIAAAIEMPQGWLYVSSGRADRWKNWGIVSLIVRVAAVLVGLVFGANGVAIASVVVGWLIAFPSVSYAGRPLGIGAVLAVKAVARPLVGASVVGALGWLLRLGPLAQSSSLTRLLLLTCVCAFVYLFVVVGVLGLSGPVRMVAKLAQGFRAQAA